MGTVDFLGSWRPSRSWVLETASHAVATKSTLSLLDWEE